MLPTTISTSSERNKWIAQCRASLIQSISSIDQETRVSRYLIRTMDIKIPVSPLDNALLSLQPRPALRFRSLIQRLKLPSTPNCNPPFFQKWRGKPHLTSKPAHSFMIVLDNGFPHPVPLTIAFTCLIAWNLMSSCRRSSTLPSSTLQLDTDSAVDRK